MDGCPTTSINAIPLIHPIDTCGMNLMEDVKLKLMLSPLKHYGSLIGMSKKVNERGRGPWSDDLTTMADVAAAADATDVSSGGGGDGKNKKKSMLEMVGRNKRKVTSMLLR